MESHLNKVRQWAMFRSTTATAADAVVPLVLRGQDKSNSHAVSGGIVDLLAGKTYLISAGLPNDSATGIKGFSVQRSTNDGATWSTVWGSGMSGATAGNSAGTSVTDVFTPSVPTKLRLNAGANGLAAGVWLYIEVK